MNEWMTNPTLKEWGVASIKEATFQWALQKQFQRVQNVFQQWKLHYNIPMAFQHDYPEWQPCSYERRLDI